MFKSVPLVPCLLLTVLISGSVHAQSISEACAMRSRQYRSDMPDALRLADYDCTRLGRPNLTDPSTNKNEQAQYMHGVQELRRLFSLAGTDISVGVWDGGRVLAEHVELDGRVAVGDPEAAWHGHPKGVPLDEHATHVSGTIASAGKNKPAAGGMAPKAHLVSYFWDNDANELGKAVAAGISITNHSYGIPAGWDLGGRGNCKENWSWLGRDTDDEDARFGAYVSHSRNFDDVVWQNKTLSIFIAAGNARGDMGNPEAFRNDPDPDVKFNGSHCAYDAATMRWKTSNKTRKANDWNDGHDTLTDRGVAKNVITIGAAVDLTVPFDRSAVKPTNFSSMGPTDDGRIKPELLANGDELTSTYLPESCLRELGKTCWADDIEKKDLRHYASLPGTSMATPVAAGIGALLNELSLRRQKRVLFADEMKAVLIHTALATTDDDSPTYAGGWGLIRAARAGALVDGKSGTLIRRTLVAGSNRLEVPLVWKTASKALSVTVAWLDEPGPAVGPLVLNDRSSVLVHKLALKLVAPSDRPHHPWSLDVRAPQKAATRSGPNLVDNAQRIHVETTDREVGTWQLVIEATKPLTINLDVAIAVNDAVALQ